MKNIKLTVLMVILGLGIQVQISFAQTDCTAAETHLANGKTLIERGKFKDAQAELSIYVACNPQKYDGYSQRARAEVLANDSDSALVDANKALALNPQDADAFNVRGLVNENNKNYEAAIKDFTDAIRLEPTSPKAYFNRSNSYAAMKDGEKAAVDINKAIELAPTVARSYVQRGLLNFSMQNWAAAEKDFSQAIKLGENTAFIYMNRGAANHNLAHYDQAIADDRKALELDANNETAKKNLALSIVEQMPKNSPSSPADTQNKPPSKFTSGRFTSDGAEIYYEIYGAKTGTPLFVLHGGPGFDHQYFLSNSAFTELGKNRPIVFYDQRGTGKSAKVFGEQSATFDNSLTDLENLRQHLGYEKIDVAGHSFGGLLAMSYAAILPERVAHLIIIDSVPAKYAADYSTFEKDYPKEFAEMQAKRFEALKNKDDKAMRASIVAYMKMLFHSPQNRDAFIAGSGEYSYNVVVNYTVNKSADDVDVFPLLAKLTLPTLILHGRYDVNITPDSSELIHKAISKSQFVIFEQSGHLPFYEEKEKFVSVVENFLGK